ATCACSPADAADDATGSPVCASSRRPVAGSVTAAATGALAESHMSGAGAAKYVTPRRSLAVMLPAASVVGVTPCAVVLNVRSARRGSAAAAADPTISTSLKPPCVSAVTARSTPGSTFRYVAVAPDRVG